MAHTHLLKRLCRRLGGSISRCGGRGSNGDGSLRRRRGYCRRRLRRHSVLNVLIECRYRRQGVGKSGGSSQLRQPLRQRGDSLAHVILPVICVAGTLTLPVVFRRTTTP